MAWALWLAIPVVATSGAAVWSWLRGRPDRLADPVDAIRAHQDYLDALVVPARGRSRTQQR
jgi:hypothetical protein